MAISNQDVQHVALLARLALSKEEVALFEQQLSKILEHAQRVTSLDTEGIEPTSHALALSNVFRSDEVVEPLPRDQALVNAPAAEADHFRVPKILDDQP